ncbi:zinc finger E-box-binding homeobox 2-like isoform X2 [Vanacampus margaritifer]
MEERARFQRRKQANPRRKDVWDDAITTAPQQRQQGQSEEDETLGSSASEYLWRSDTAVIYPEDPDEGTAPLGPDAHRAKGREAELQSHVTAQKPIREQLPDEGTVNRKFKCGQCGKAFKYKHHLKEHLRIHSGEKPYECSNCKKRFSHSGSYSSHISSRKCVGPTGLHRRPQRVGSATNCSTSSSGAPCMAPALARLRHKLENGRARRQNRLDVQYETTDSSLDYGLMMTSQRSFGRPGGPKVPGLYTNGFISNSHLGKLDIDFLLPRTRESMDDVHNMCRQKMDSNPEEVLKLRAYMKVLGAQMEEKNLRSSPTRSFMDDTVELVNQGKGESDQNIQHKTKQTNLSKEESCSVLSCRFCKETFPGPIPLHQHERYLCKMNKDIQAVLHPAGIIPGLESSEWPVSTKEPCASPRTPNKDHLSVMQTNWAMDMEPDSEELIKISLAVGLPQEFVRDWFSQRIPSPPGGGGSELHQILRRSPKLSNGDAFLGQLTTKSPGDRTPDPLDHNSRSPLNLSSSSSKQSQSTSYTPNSLVWEDHHADTPLDLSVPKHLAHQFAMKSSSNGLKLEPRGPQGVQGQTSGSVDLLDAKKAFLASEGGKNCHQMEKSATFGINPSLASPLYQSLPPHGTFSPPTFMSPTQYPVLETMNFIPQMAYTYASGAAIFADIPHARKKTWQATSQRSLLDGSPDYLSGAEQLTESQSKVTTASGTASGKRPHNCHVCQKAFKHKHHLIEHSRLHSGEKPYQCDKCGKRFSHSGSYSQHMNHRYSYCKREAQERRAQRPPPDAAYPDHPVGPSHSAPVLTAAQGFGKEEEVRTDSAGEQDPRSHR